MGTVRPGGSLERPFHSGDLQSLAKSSQMKSFGKSLTFNRCLLDTRNLMCIISLSLDENPVS